VDPAVGSDESLTPSMSGYLSNLLTTTTSRYNSLKRQLLSDEADGDTEDDTHITRVLRAYYTEKGRAFPQWLPPDPKAPQSAPAQFVTSSGRPQASQQMGRGGGLSDLWDAPRPQQQQQDPMSLRRAQPQGRGPRAFQGRQGVGNTLSPEPQVQGRPLPSQRTGSYQSSFGGGAADPSPPPSSGSGVSAQERLKARLWGSGRSTSPSNSAPPSTSTSPAPGGARRSPFDRSGAQGGRPPYPDERGGGYPSGGGRPQYPTSQSSYGMSSNAPWVGNDDPYGQPGGGYGGSSQRPPPGGLPSGPRRR
jgi:hypothetical protein